ncbi:MAG TPA: winged helix-turn-helix domain-containing protein [Candidatus Solibacter sp.]|nr:winged helix-turn-helix domain-containing protein [Candidatus Solibacter sp.]
MPVSSSSPARIRFGSLELDLTSGELHNNGRIFPLPRKSFEILRVLAEHPGEVVTRDELRNKLWSTNTFVEFDDGLNHAVQKLRQVLGDSVEHPQFIETLPRYGYRFIGFISPNGDGSRAPGKQACDAPTQNIWKRWVIGFVAVAALMGGILWLKSPLPAPRVVSYKQLTRDGREKNRPCYHSYSRLVTDGARVYFSEEHSRLMQVSVSGGDAASIPTPIDCFSILAISPDKTELIGTSTFLRDEPLWLLSMVNGQARRVGDLSGHKAAWSPDGQSIVYATGPTHDQAVNEVWVAKKDGSGSHRLARIERGVISSLMWSPDGKVIRMDDWDEDSVHVWEMSSDGSNMHRLAITPKGNRQTPYGSWTPDQKYFIFAADSDSGAKAIWALRERQGFFQRSSAKPVQLTSGATDFLQAAPSPDAKQIFVIGSIQRGELLRYDLPLKRLEPYLSGISAEHLDFSRDGKWMTYITFPEAILWRSRVDGSERMQLTTLPLRAFLPRWSPDGMQIAFAGKLPGEYLKIYIVSAGGGQPRMVAQADEHWTDPAWAANGHTLIFGPSFFSPHPRLYSLDLTTNHVSIIPGSDGMYGPLVSPDGRFIVAGEAPGNRKLFVFDRQNQKWSDVVELRQPGPLPLRWSDDNRYLFFSLISDHSHAPLYRLRIADRRLEELAVVDVPQGMAGAFGPRMCLTPDGSPVVLRDASIQEIYALDVDLP